MADFDLASNVLPLAGTAAGVALDGSVATAAIDTQGFGSVAAVLTTANLIAYSAVSWAWTECDTVNGTYTAVPADDVIVPRPKVLSNTSRVFHSGCRSKKRYVKVAPTATGGGVGQVTAMLGHPDSGPVFQSAHYDQWSA